MLTVYIRNIKTVKNIANYKYVVMVNAEKIAEGEIKKHNRTDGWAKLVKRIAEQNDVLIAESNEKCYLRPVKYNI